MVAFVAALADAFKTFAKSPASMPIHDRTKYRYHQRTIR
jgi:hypothetical protein